MKRIMYQKALTAALLLCISVYSPAQQNNPKYEFGLNLGFLVYQGDLTPKRLGSFETQKLALGLHASRLISASLAARANLVWGKLKGDDGVYENPDYRKQRNFNFTSPVFELSAQLLWNPLRRNYIDRGFSPYIFAGGGFSILRVRRDWSNISTTYFNPEVSEVWAGLAADSAHALPRIIPVVPVGAGVRYYFSPRLGINAEASYRLAYTDYIDGFSQAANPKRNDHYANYSIGIVYRTGKKDLLKCPVMRY